MYEKPASVAGEREPVALVPRSGKVVVSPPASATVTVAAFPPMFSVEVAAKASAVPAEFEYSKELAVKEVMPVPPRFTARVPVVSPMAMPKVEVATQDGRPVVNEV